MILNSRRPAKFAPPRQRADALRVEPRSRAMILAILSTNNFILPQTYISTIFDIIKQAELKFTCFVSVGHNLLLF